MVGRGQGIPILLSIFWGRERERECVWVCVFKREREMMSAVYSIIGAINPKTLTGLRWTFTNWRAPNRRCLVLYSSWCSIENVGSRDKPSIFSFVCVQVSRKFFPSQHHFCKAPQTDKANHRKSWANHIPELDGRTGGPRTDRYRLELGPPRIRL